MAPISPSSSSLEFQAWSGDSASRINNYLSALAPRSFQISKIPLPASDRLLKLLHIRQQDSDVIPTTYGSINRGPSPGTVVGIVLGSVGGFLLLLWLFYTCANMGNYSGSSEYTEEVVVRDRKRRSHGK